MHVERLTKEQVIELILLEDDFFVLKFITYSNILGILDKEDLDLLTDIIIKKNSSELLCQIAMMVDGVDIEKIEDALIEIGDVHYLAKFADTIEGANVSKLKDAIRKHNFNTRGKK